MESSAAQGFTHLYGGAPPRVFRAPGRVNLIGEHTDYNGGFVMPAALPFATRAAVGPRRGRRVRMHSEHFQETVEFDLDDPGAPRPPTRHWSAYVQGVASALESAGHPLCGANLWISGDVPPGAGLSSSAALEVACALALLANSGLTLDPLEVARLCQRGENEYVGARCGIMDQFAACFGRQDHAILLDCRSLEARYLPLPGRIALVICDSMVRHELASGEYNRRREQCEEAVRVLSRPLPGITALRDVGPQQLACFRGRLDPTVYRRARHVISENHRALDAADALERGDFARFGERMIASHRSLRDDYEVSCPELDLLVDLALREPGVYGSRMTGGGFGGCTISLVDADRSPDFVRRVADAYLQQAGIRCRIRICSAAAGAGEETEARA